MDIREYLFRNKIRQGDFARRVGISEPALTSYVHRRTSPTLERALHIYKMTNGKVTPEEMVALNESGKPKYNSRKSRSRSLFGSKKPLKDKGDTV